MCGCGAGCFSVTLAFVLFPLAQSDFGEREHLALSLLVPFRVVGSGSVGGRAGHGWSSLLDRTACRKRLRSQASLPHPLAGVRILLRMRGRVPPRTLLPESVAVAGFVVGYVALIALVAPAYFDLVRLLAVPYSRFLYDPFYRLLATGSAAGNSTLFALLAFIALRPHARHPAALDDGGDGHGRVPGRRRRAAEGIAIPLLPGIRPGHADLGARSSRQLCFDSQPRTSRLPSAGGRRAGGDGCGRVRRSDDGRAGVGGASRTGSIRAAGGTST